MAEVGPRLDRNEVFLEYTKSVCPLCKAVVDGEVNIRDDRVYLRKRCRQHGQFEALIYSDAGMYLDSQRFNKPGSIPLQTQTEVVDGCPLDCGLCPEHKQHACLGLMEVNSSCNLDCPVCFADSGRHHADAFQLTWEQVEAGLDAFVRAEGEPEVVMFSGGEPTLHPHILDFLAMARDKGIRQRVLNTNGIRLARDPGFAEALRSLRCHVYLQFDGFEPATHLALRGRDLRAVKEAALARCAEAGVTVSLTATVEKGLNDHEVGDIVRFGVRHPAVNSVVLQPTTHAGRMLTFDPLDRLTNPDVIKAIAAQVPEWLRVSDFFPRAVLLSHLPQRHLPAGRRGRGHADPSPDPTGGLPRLRHQPGAAGQGHPKGSGEALERLGRTGQRPDRRRAGVRHLRGQLARRGAGAGRQGIHDRRAGLPGSLHAERQAADEVLRGADHPRRALIPFCAYNSVGYREQVREQLTGISQAPLVPNALPLRPLLSTTRHGSKTGADGLSVSLNETNVGRRLQ